MFILDNMNDLLLTVDAMIYTKLFFKRSYWHLICRQTVSLIDLKLLKLSG
jgi:hypothetical protein